MNLHSSIGIDLGSSKIVISVAKKGGVEILCNDASYRQTPTVVSFGPERIVGDKAIQKIKKNINNSILLPPRWIGELTPAQLSLEKKFNFSKVQLDEGRRAVFNVNFEGEQIKVPATQVLAGVFKEALEVIRLNQIDQKEAVVSVPSYFTPVERQAVLDAAKIAGMEVTKLYNESTANIMNYGIFRRSDLDASTPRLVGFVDMGHSKTSVFFANIWKDKAEIVCELSNPNLGTRNLDHNMQQFYVRMFDSQHRIDLNEAPKSMFRLLEAIEKQRKILTANPEAVLSIECIYEEIDFSHLLKRDEFESINKEVVQQLAVLIQQAVKELPADLAKNIHSVERIGGGTRIPFVERLIAETFKIEAVSKTLDASESIARGCAIQSAMLNPLFRLPPFSIPEKLTAPVSIKLQYEGEEEKKKDLFKAGSEFGKSLSVGVMKPLALKVALVAQDRLTGEEREVSRTTVDKLVSKEEKFEGKVCLLLDRNGLPIIERCELRETYVVEEKTPIKKAAPTPAPATKDAPKPEGDTKMEIETPEAKEEFKIEKKEKTRVTNVQFQQQINLGLERAQIESFKQFEAHISAKEQLIRDTQQAKYFLESFIYNTRNQLNLPQNQTLSLPAEKDRILAELQAGENWLYDDGAHADKGQYEAHLAKVKAVALPFTSRLTKIEQAKNYFEEATLAFRDYQTKNAELIAQGSPLHLNELTQKHKEGQDLLGHFQALFANFTIANIDAFNFEEKKNAINKAYESLNNVLATIKKEKEQQERDAKKKAEEEAKKKADEEAKKKADEEAKKKAESDGKKDDAKMDIEK